jgi:thioredoxin reductase
MARVTIVGDGPGGLSAALFLAKNGHEVIVYGQDKTAMHYAYVYNYLGLPEIAGTEFQEIARDQVTGFGARIVDAEVTAVEAGERLTVTTAGGTEETDYLILTEGKNPVLAASLGLVPEEGAGVPVDANYRSSIDKVYVVGRSVRPTRSQAIISAGAGAVAAVDILAREEGKDIQDWDTPPKED